MIQKNKLKDILSDEPDFEFQNMNGDIVFKKDDKTILVIERKTKSDLYSSIKDEDIKNKNYD